MQMQITPIILNCYNYDNIYYNISNTFILKFQSGLYGVGGPNIRVRKQGCAMCKRKPKKTKHHNWNKTTKTQLS